MSRAPMEHSYAEHVADGVVHGIGVVAAIVGVLALLIWAALRVPLEAHWPLWLYAVGLLTSFICSAAYNMTLHRKLRPLLRRFDHAAIFLFTAGTYTPMAVIGLGGATGLAIAVAAWSLAVLGVTLKLAFFHRWYRLSFALYLIQGWLGVLAAWPLVQTLPVSVSILLLLGGVVFTIGTIFHHWERLRFNRAIWHSHVLIGAALHYAAVVLIVAR
ncbi:MAG: DNA-binding protein [Rhodobacterales bacterium]|nr:MAG: DNA-binding protein [Rhodobacterales bacterium]